MIRFFYSLTIFLIVYALGNAQTAPKPVVSGGGPATSITAKPGDYAAAKPKDLTDKEKAAIFKLLAQTSQLQIKVESSPEVQSLKDLQKKLQDEINSRQTADWRLNGDLEWEPVPKPPAPPQTQQPQEKK